MRSNKPAERFREISSWLQFSPVHFTRSYCASVIAMPAFQNSMKSLSRVTSAVSSIDALLMQLLQMPVFITSYHCVGFSRHLRHKLYFVTVATSFKPLSRARSATFGFVFRPSSFNSSRLFKTEHKPGIVLCFVRIR